MKLPYLQTIKSVMRSFKRLTQNLLAFLMINHWLLRDTPLDVVSISGWLDQEVIWHRFDNLIIKTVVVVLATVLLLYSYIQRRLATHKLFFCVLFYVFLYGVMSLMFGHYQDYSNNLYVVFISTLSGLLAALWLSRQDAPGLLIACTVIQAAYAIWGVKSGQDIFISGTVVRAEGTLGHPNNLYPLLSVVFPVVLAASITHQGGEKRKLAFLLGATLILSALILCWFRSAGFAIAAASIFVTWASTRQVRPTLVTALVAVTLLVVLVHGRTTGEVNRKSTERSNAGHMRLWRAGVQIAFDHPLQGVGLGCLEIPTPDVSNQKIQIEPKNLLLYWLCEMGVLGGVLFFSFVIFITNAIRNAHPVNLAFRIQISAAWICLIGIGLFDTPFGTPDRYAGNCVFGFMLGLTLLLGKYNRHEMARKEFLYSQPHIAPSLH